MLAGNGIVGDHIWLSLAVSPLLKPAAGDPPAHITEVPGHHHLSAAQGTVRSARRTASEAFFFQAMHDQTFM